MKEDTPVRIIAKEVSKKASTISDHAGRLRRLADNMDGLKAYTEIGIKSIQIEAKNKNGHTRKIYISEDYESIKQVVEFVMGLSREEFQNAANEIKKTAGEF